MPGRPGAAPAWVLAQAALWYPPRDTFHGGLAMRPFALTMGLALGAVVLCYAPLPPADAG